jgi:outer membrane protein TolC
MTKPLLFLVLLSFHVNAETGSPPKPIASEFGLTSVLKTALNKSLERSAAQIETAYQESNSNAVSKSQLVPSIALSATYQKLYYDRMKDNGTGNFVSNNGQNTSYGLTISYDLQKLFGPESVLAKQSHHYAQLQEKITTRDIVRNVKKAYYNVTEIQAEVADLNKLIALFSRIEGILQKQKQLGVFNELERQQFQVQKSILNSDLQTRKADLDAAYYQLASLINTSPEELKAQIPADAKKENVKPYDVDSEKIAKMSDNEMIENLSREYNISKLEFEKTSSLPLPTVYVKGQRDNPVYFSSDGPLTTAEIGIVIPIDSLFTRSSQKSQLGAKAEKNEMLMRRALYDYRNQVNLNAANLARFKSQTVSLENAQNETEKLLDKTFLYYSQKRLDVLGTLDIFQKYLQSSKNMLMNEMQIASTEAELEYLVGGIN